MANQRILVVDDDPTIRGVLVQICQRNGYDAQSASDGAEALHLLRDTSFDLITMDLMMANMDGIDAIAVMRNETDLPVVAISAHVTPDIRAELARQGVQHILEKPFNQADVMKIIHQALEAHKA